MKSWGNGGKYLPTLLEALAIKVRACTVYSSPFDLLSYLAASRDSYGMLFFR